MTGSDQFYFDISKANEQQVSTANAQTEVEANEALRQSGAGYDDAMRDYDVVAMREAGMPMDGTVSNEFAKPGARQVGRRDARTGEALASPSTEDPELFPSELEIMAGGVGAAAKAVGATAARGVYDFGRSIWSFSADLAEFMGVDPAKTYRAPPAGEVGIPEPHGAAEEMVSEVIRYGLGFMGASKALQGLATAPKIVAGSTTGRVVEGMGSAAVADFVVGDPRRDSVYDAMVNLFGAELTVAGHASIAQMSEASPEGAMAGRLALAGEGAALGVIAGTAMQGVRYAGEAGHKVAQQLWMQADELEQTATQALARGRGTLHSGLDPADAGWLGVWMAARIAKGAKRLTVGMKNQLRGSGATEDQMTQYWDQAATMSQEARSEAAETWLDSTLERAAYASIEQGDVALTQFNKTLSDLGIDEAAGREIWDAAAERYSNEQLQLIAGEPFRTPDPGSGLSGLELLTDPMKPIRAEGSKKATARDFQARAFEAAGGMPRNLDESPENVEQVGRFLAREAEMASRQPGSAIDWYGKSIEEYHDLAAERWPQLKTDPTERLAFDYATAVTSNGEQVSQNLRLTAQVYDYFTEHGKFPTTVASKRGKDMGDAFQLWNTAVDTVGRENWERFLHTEWSAAQLRAMGFKGVTFPEGELAPGSIVLGPKIGGAFFQNLEGNMGRSTIDLWYRRTFGRATGEVMISSPELAASRATRLQEAATTPQARALLKTYTGDEALPEDPEAMSEVAAQVFNGWSRDQAELGKAYATGISSEADEFHRAARGYNKLTNEPVDGPSDIERRVIDAGAGRAVEILQDAGYDATPADLQALLWYWEQRLWKRSGVDLDSSTDYPSEMAKLLQENGTSEGTIERVRGTARRRGRAGDDTVGAARRSGAHSSGLAGGDAGRRQFFAKWSGDDYRARIRNGAATPGAGVYRGRSSRSTARAVAPGGGTQKLGGKLWSVADQGHAGGFKSVGIAVPKFIELDPSQQSVQGWHATLTKARDGWDSLIENAPTPEHAKRYQQAKLSTSVAPADNFGDARLFLTEEGDAGFALRGDEIVGVFKDPHSTAKDVTLNLLALAIEAGGRTLSTFDGPTLALFQHAGMRPVARTPFDLKLKPEGWDARRLGKPDVVLMAFDPTSTGKPVDLATVPAFPSYDGAAAARDAQVRSYRGEPAPEPPDGA